MESGPELSIIIVSYNVRQLVLNCVQSIIDTTGGIEYEIIMVDNASSDGSAEAVTKTFPGVHVIANKENVGFAGANNQGYEISKGEFILLLNPDTLVKPHAIGSTLTFLKNTPDAAIAGCRLLNADASLQKSIQLFPSLRVHIASIFFLDRFLYPQTLHRTYYRKNPFKIDFCSGAFMLIRREALGKETLLTPKYFMYSEEKDLCLRMGKKGWKTYFVPFGEVIHFGGQSTQQAPREMFLELMKSQIIFFRRHYSGIYMHSMIWSFYLSIVSAFAASFFLSFTRKGYRRFCLFKESVVCYPGFVRLLMTTSRKRLDQDEKRSKYNKSKLTSLANQLMKLPVVDIRMSGDGECRYYYKEFIMAHPKYKVIQNKRWGVCLIALPETFSFYLKGRKIQALRTNRNRTVQMGYKFYKFAALDRLDEMMTINVSMEKRQGWPMSQDYLKRDEVVRFFTQNPPLFGVFNSENVLRAYAYVLVSGDVAFFVRILGHGEDLEKGMMYFLVSEVVRELIELKPNRPKWLMYDTYFGAQPGLKYFKERCGFEPYKVNWIWQEKPV